jgi:hypothetical protein
MDKIPITGLVELESHLQQLVQDPETPLNAKLFDEVELQLTGKQMHLGLAGCWHLYRLCKMP